MLKLLILLFPLRDALGIYFAGMPLRFGEIGSAIASIPLFIKGHLKIDKWPKRIIVLLFFNLVLTIVGVWINKDSVDLSFAAKYVLRNILNLVFIAGFLAAEIKLSPQDIKSIFKITIIVEIVTYIINAVIHVRFEMGRIVPISMATFGNFSIPKMYGTCMEPGYLVPLLALVLYYYLQAMTCYDNSGNAARKARICVFITIILAMLTFSTAVYFTVFITILYIVIKTVNNRRLQRFLLNAFLGTFVLAAIMVANSSLRVFLEQNVVQKIGAYIFHGNQKYANFSADTRAQHIRAAINWFGDGNILQMFLGHGTGGYWQYSRSLMGVLDSEVSEAFNLYLSTLTDRGILGFIIVIGVIFCSWKMTDSKDWMSKSLFWGILMQSLHWMLTGNFWLYYFWYNIVFIIGYNKYKHAKEQEHIYV